MVIFHSFVVNLPESTILYNVGKTIVKHPPKQIFDRWYGYHSQSWGVCVFFTHILHILLPFGVYMCQPNGYPTSPLSTRPSIRLFLNERARMLSTRHTLEDPGSDRWFPKSWYPQSSKSFEVLFVLKHSVTWGSILGHLYFLVFFFVLKHKVTWKSPMFGNPIVLWRTFHKG
jgi:hypothetical protein